MRQVTITATYQNGTPLPPGETMTVELWPLYRRQENGSILNNRRQTHTFTGSATVTMDTTTPDWVWVARLTPKNMPSWVEYFPLLPGEIIDYTEIPKTSITGVDPDDVPQESWWAYARAAIIDADKRNGHLVITRADGTETDLGRVDGLPGATGHVPTLKVSETVTVDPDTPANVTRVQSPLTGDYTDTFTIPRGEQGEPGQPGESALGTEPQQETIANWVTGDNPLSTALNTQIGEQVAPAISATNTVVAQRVPSVIQVPAGMDFDTPINIIRTRDGYLTNMNPESRHVQADGPTYYVDPVDGSNTNDGLTQETAFATPAYASQKNGRNFAEIIIINSGVWDRTSGSMPLKAGVSLRTLPGVKATIIIGDILTGWTPSGGAYTAAIANCNGVFDAGYTDAYGDPTPLTPVDSLAVVQSTPGTYYYADGAVTVHTPDSRVPDDDVYVGRPVPGLSWASGTTGDNGTAYMEGIEWWGGTTTANLTAPGDNWRVYAKNCGWHGAGTGNGVAAWGLAELILVNCTANHNRLDGFNYTENNGRTGQFIEINCSARNNGRDGGSNNGSSSHGSYKGIRVAGDYFENEGANIADVNNTRTFNVGCTAGGSTDYEQDFYTNGTGQMWLEDCIATSPRSITAIDDSIIHARNTAATGTITGNVVGY